MANGNVLAVLDLTVLKYLASRGFTEAHAALKQRLRMDESQAVASHYDLVGIFLGYLNGQSKEIQAPAHQVRSQSQNGQLSQPAYESLLMASDQQGIGQGALDGNEVKRMRAPCGRVPIMAGLGKRKMDARMMPNGSPYSQHRQLIQLPTGHTLTLEQCRLLQQQRSMYQRIRHRQNSGLNLQGAPNSGANTGSGGLHVMNGMVANGGQSMNAHSLGLQQQQSPSQHLSSQHAPGLSSSLSGYNGVPGGGAHLYNLTGGHPASPWVGGASGLQSIRQVQNMHGGGLGGIRSVPVPHFGNQANPAVQLPSRASSAQLNGHMMAGGWQQASQNTHLLSPSIQAPRSLHHAMQLQSQAHHGLDMQAGGTVQSSVQGTVDGSPRSPMLTPIRTAIGGDAGDDGQKCGSIAPLRIPEVDILGQEKGLHAGASPSVNEVSPCGSNILTPGETVPVSLRYCQSPSKAQEIVSQGKGTTASSTHNGNVSNTGNVGLGNSSSASSTDVNGELGGVGNQLDTPSSDKDAMGLDNLGIKDSVLEWDSAELDVGSSAGMLTGMSNEMLQMDSLGFDAIHPIDTLEAFLNPGT
ncbi:hypothetical protein BSKO_13086 [Bryopsis sp. KO-2023]|nr:hypothetical protein BSKO_13086 [Bryopsis sp. KO-2023]